MGYKSTDKKEGQDLVYEGEVNLPTVLETATDLLVMHEEIYLLQEMVQHLINEKRDTGVQLEVLVTLRQNSKSYEEAWATVHVMGSQASDGSEYQTYANLPLKHEQLHAPNALHHHPSTSSPQMYSQPGNLVTPTQQSTHYRNVLLITGSPQQQHSTHGVADNQIVPMTQGIAPQQYGPPNSQVVSQYQTNFAPPHATSQSYHHPPPNVDQSFATTDVSQPRQQVAVSQYQSGTGPAVSQYQSDHGPAVSQYQLGPGPAVSQYHSDPRPAVSQYQLGPGPAISQYHSDPRPAVSQYHPGPRPAISQYPPGPRPAGRGQDGTQASNPTHYQNYSQTENESVTHQTGASHLSHSENVDPADLNVLRQCMEPHNMPPSTSQQSLNETIDSINPDTLPPPIMDFSSHVGSTPVTPYSERLESGPIMSGIVGDRDGLSLLPPSESGPLGLQISESGDHSPKVTYNHSISKSSGEHSTNVPYDRKFSSGSESDDLYSSGPVKPAHKYQRSSSSSVPPLPEEDRIEESWVVLEKDDIPSVPSTPKSPQPTLVTQGSQDREARPLDSEVRPIPKPRRLPDKTQSVDVVEDQKRGEKVHPMVRSCKSGSNLLDAQHVADQSTSTTLDKPTPRPRSRSPSPAASSNENSPSASPTPLRRNIQQLQSRPPDQRSNHETWPPTGPSKQLKASTLPRQTQSVDTESENKREMSHFSSGSNIHDGERLRLNLKSSTAQNNIEPDTPVKGIIPPSLRKMQNASSTDQVPPSKLTSRGHGKESVSSISQSPVSSPTQPLLAQPTDSHPLSDKQPHTDDTSTPAVPSSQSSAPYSPSEGPPSLHPVGDFSHHSSSPVKETSHSRSSVCPAPATKAPPVVGTTGAKADVVITSKPDESRLDRGGESAEALRKNIDQGRNPEESAMRNRAEEPTMRSRANALSQKSGNVGKKDEVAVKDVTTDQKGLDDSTTELELKYGISLTGTWACSYCTNLVQESDIRCDVCNKHRYETSV